MILDDSLVAPGHEDEMLDPRFACLVDDVLDDGPIDDREHFFRYGLGRGKKAGAEPGYRKDCLADFFHR